MSHLWNRTLYQLGIGLSQLGCTLSMWIPGPHVLAHVVNKTSNTGLDELYDSLELSCTISLWQNRVGCVIKGERLSHAFSAFFSTHPLCSLVHYSVWTRSCHSKGNGSPELCWRVSLKQKSSEESGVKADILKSRRIFSGHPLKQSCLSLSHYVKICFIS